MTRFLQEMFGVRKPVIAMAHVPALPGTPRYDTARGLEGLIDSMRQDIQHNTGARIETIHEFLSIADGVIVGSCLKVDGCTWNPVDPARVQDFMKAVNEVRS